MHIFNICAHARHTAVCLVFAWWQQHVCAAERTLLAVWIWILVGGIPAHCPCVDRHLMLLNTRISGGESCFAHTQQDTHILRISTQTLTILMSWISAVQMDGSGSCPSVLRATACASCVLRLYMSTRLKMLLTSIADPGRRAERRGHPDRTRV